jgi:hypothetical protein
MRVQLTNIQRQVLESIEYEYPYGLVRKLMGSDEIKAANALVKMGLVSKGNTDDKQGSVHYMKN